MSRGRNVNQRDWLEKERKRLRAYRATAKGKAATRLWHRTEACKAARSKYVKTETYRLAEAKKNARKIWIGREYHSMAKTPELAAAIRSHIKNRLGVLKQGKDTCL